MWEKIKSDKKRNVGTNIKYIKTCLFLLDFYSDTHNYQK